MVFTFNGGIGCINTDPQRIVSSCRKSLEEIVPEDDGPE
jgi:hypothetical protein